MGISDVLLDALDEIRIYREESPIYQEPPELVEKLDVAVAAMTAALHYLNTPPSVQEMRELDERRKKNRKSVVAKKR
jgi:hypothetical protein